MVTVSHLPASLLQGSLSWTLPQSRPRTRSWPRFGHGYSYGHRSAMFVDSATVTDSATAMSAVTATALVTIMVSHQHPASFFLQGSLSWPRPWCATSNQHHIFMAFSHGHGYGHGFGLGHGYGYDHGYSVSPATCQRHIFIAVFHGHVHGQCVPPVACQLHFFMPASCYSMTRSQ